MYFHKKRKLRNPVDKGQSKLFLETGDERIELIDSLASKSIFPLPIGKTAFVKTVTIGYFLVSLVTTPEH